MGTRKKNGVVGRWVESSGAFLSGNRHSCLYHSQKTTKIQKRLLFSVVSTLISVISAMCDLICILKKFFSLILVTSDIHHNEKNWLITKKNVLRFASFGLLINIFVSLPNFALGSNETDTATAVQSKPPVLIEATQELVITKKKGLLSLKVVNIEFEQLMAKLSEVSGIQIKLMDQAEAKTKITISIEEMKVKEVVGKIMSALPAGGYVASYGESGSVQTINIITKKGAEHFKAEMQLLIDRINKGDQPKPDVIKDWLLRFAAYGFPIDPAGSGIFMLPVLQYLDANYDEYANLVLTIFRDTKVISPLRFAMLELLERHWEHPATKESMLAVFNAEDNAVLQGATSLALARHGVSKIGDEVVNRYSNEPAEARFYYAKTLAKLNRKDAASLLHQDAKQTQDLRLQISSVGALIKLDPSSAPTESLFNEIVNAAKPIPSAERSASDLGRESVAMNAVIAMGHSGAPNTNQKLLSIASDKSTAVDVRITALESIASRVDKIAASERALLNNKVVEFEENVPKEQILSSVNKERMLTRIRTLQKMITLSNEGER